MTRPYETARRVLDCFHDNRQPWMFESRRHVVTLQVMALVSHHEWRQVRAVSP